MAESADCRLIETAPGKSAAMGTAFAIGNCGQPDSRAGVEDDRRYGCQIEVLTIGRVRQFTDYHYYFYYHYHYYHYFPAPTRLRSAADVGLRIHSGLLDGAEMPSLCQHCCGFPRSFLLPLGASGKQPGISSDQLKPPSRPLGGRFLRG